MVMITFLGASVKEYLDCYGEKSPDFPADCPICGSCKPHRHGHFDRWAVDADSEIQIPIYRYLCQAENKVEGQDKTISLLPNFLWPFRCMLSEFVEKAVCLRVDDRLSWDELVDNLNSRPGLVSGKTVRRWVNALAKTFAEVHTKLLSLLLKYFPGLNIPPEGLTGDRKTNLSVGMSLGRFLRQALASALPDGSYLVNLPVFSVLHCLFGVNFASEIPQSLSLPGIGTHP